MFQQLRQKLFQSSNRENIILAYKLLHDSLFLWLALLVFALISEGLITGIISSRLEIYVIVSALILNLLLIQGLRIGAKIEDTKKAQKNKKIAWVLFFILGLLIFNSLLKLNIYLNIFILAITAAIVYFLIKVFQERQS